MLKANFQAQGSDLSTRAKTVNRLLQKQAKLSQHTLLQKVEQKWNNETRNMHSFWIANLVVLEATRTAILDLANDPEVLLIDLEDGYFLPPKPIIETSKQKASTPNGIEPGLTAINAPAMWNLGYTGRGRLVYNYDTGVWPTHPSFEDRFLANFYPMSQSWTGFFGSLPNGSVSDHGTHTLGTIAGLDTATNDTIGVAFGSYWIANDFVTSTVQGLPPIARMVGAFQWALNPDGDTSTTDDIPDVINNSWRWYDGNDTIHCGGYVVDLMNAIEAAGIANVFSGGNSGPNNSSVNSPQRINTSKVNTFSVGSINGNLPFPHPISNFSTRGPAQCPGSGSLLIHPEVVAPGQNVRSAWGKDGHNTISGTSMAAPHVSGAVLLLKEAFPNVAGDELLQALYITAIDMGATGEDNIYGNGLIDVYAAYQHLALTHTPINPNQIDWDLAIVKVSSPANNGVTCLSSYSPQITLMNKGDSSITEIDIDYKLDNSTPQNFNWTGSLAAGQSVMINLPAISFTTFGEIELILHATIGSHSPQEFDVVNNHRRLRFSRLQETNLPLVEDFESGMPNNWFIANDDAALTWDTTQITGRTNNSIATTLPFYHYTPRSSQKDGLVSPSIDLLSTSSPSLRFDLAYHRLYTVSQLQDTLRVWASIDCGTTFPHKLYEKYGASLNTYSVRSPDYKPQSEAEWRRDTVDLSSLAGSKVLLKFEGVNQNGNNLYLDNISVFDGPIDPISIKELHSLDFTLYPNPASAKLNIEIRQSLNSSIRVQILDASGRMVIETQIVKSGEIDISLLHKGLYFVRLTSKHSSFSSKFIKE